MKDFNNLIGIVKDRTIFDIIENVKGNTWKLHSSIYDLILSVEIREEDILIRYINRVIDDYSLPRAYNNLYLDLLPELEKH